MVQEERVQVQSEQVESEETSGSEEVETREVDETPGDIADYEPEEGETPARTAQRLREQGLIGKKDDESPDGNTGKKEAKPDEDTTEAAEVNAEEEENAEGGEDDDSGADIDPDLLPPHRLNNNKRLQKMFHNMPKGMKRAVNQMVREVQSGASREIQQAKQETQYIHDLVAPYAKKWGERGFPVTQVLSELIATHEQLSDPATKRAAYLKLGRNLGIDTTAISTPDDMQNSQDSAVRQEIDQLKSYINQQQQASVEADIRSQIENVARETDPSGQPLYPEVSQHGFFSRVGTSVMEWRRHLSQQFGRNISYGDALKSYIHEQRKMYGGNPSPVQSPEPHVAASTNGTNEQQLRRAEAASVSARGRSVSSNSPSSWRDRIDSMDISELKGGNLKEKLLAKQLIG